MGSVYLSVTRQEVSLVRDSLSFVEFRNEEFERARKGILVKEISPDGGFTAHLSNLDASVIFSSCYAQSVHPDTAPSVKAAIVDILKALGDGAEAAGSRIRVMESTKTYRSAE